MMTLFCDVINSQVCPLNVFVFTGLGLRNCYTHTHTHTHIYIYMHLLCVQHGLGIIYSPAL